MTGGKKLALASVAVLAITACGADKGKLEIRSVAGALAPGRQPVPLRIAEARSYLALNNVGLALESFRKAIREDPTSIDAMTGIAECYDRMGRFDLSRRHHEMALAQDPTDPALYAGLAASLDLQGKSAEAAKVRDEMATRLSALAAPAPVVTAAAAEQPAPEVTQASVTVALAPPRPLAAQPAPVATAAPAPIEHAVATVPSAKSAPEPTRPIRGTGSVTVALAPARPLAEPTGVRLERISAGQVALITSKRAPRMAALPAMRSGSAPIMLLNAARHQGLAARTRSYLTQKGWQRIAIGDAPTVASRSTILYPAARSDQARRLANQFGFALRHGPSSADRLTILLGRDAAARRWLAGKPA